MNLRFISDPGQIPSLSKIYAFHERPEGASYYHEILVPFSFSIMSVRAGKPEKSTLSIYTPEVSVRLPPSLRYAREKGMTPHFHNGYEFAYVVSGSMYQIVEGRRYYFPAGSCCLMNKNTLHAEESTTDFTCVFLTVTDEFLQQMRENSRNALFPGETEVFRNPIFRFLDRASEQADADLKDFLDFVPKIAQAEQEALVKQTFERMLQVLIDPGCGATWELQAALLQLIRALGDDTVFHREHVTWESSMERLLLSRIDRILNQRHGRITNRELAELLHYNGSYLGRIVKRHTGKSLFDYSMDFTMGFAALELRQTDKSASAIAAELRFTNHTHFYRIFRQHYGMTPSEYRLRHGKDAGGAPGTVEHS